MGEPEVGAIVGRMLSVGDIVGTAGAVVTRDVAVGASLLLGRGTNCGSVGACVLGARVV